MKKTPIFYSKFTARNQLERSRIEGRKKKFGSVMIPFKVGKLRKSHRAATTKIKKALVILII